MMYEILYLKYVEISIIIKKVFVMFFIIFGIISESFVYDCVVL